MAYFTFKQARETFDRYAHNYEVTYKLHKSDMLHFIEKAAIGPTESVLDLGTGTGWVVERAKARTTGRIIGVDGSPRMVEKATAEHGSDQVTFVVGNIITMAGLDAVKPAGGFDVITCCSTFSNVHPHRRVDMLTRWKSFLAPGGRIIFDCQHPVQDLGRMDCFVAPPLALLLGNADAMRPVGRLRVGDRTSITETEQEMRRLAGAAGLKEIGAMEKLGAADYQDKKGQLFTHVQGLHGSAPTRHQIEAAKYPFLEKELLALWCADPTFHPFRQVVFQHKVVAVVGVWESVESAEV